jgi:hypothetical protein
VSLRSVSLVAAILSIVGFACFAPRAMAQSLVIQTSGGHGGYEEEEEGERDLVGRPQVYLTPGVIVRSLSWMPGGTSFRGGVQIGLTHDREYDYRVLGSFSWEF